MEEVELYKYTLDKISNQEWHWFDYHFKRLHPFAVSLVKTCYEIEQVMPSQGIKFLDEIAGIGGVEKDLGHYQQLLQKCSEILAIRQILLVPWVADVSFEFEPKAPGSEKRPEFVVSTEGRKVGFEVKAPALLDHQNKRYTNDVQIPGRHFPPEMVEMLKMGKEATFPRDNPVKDFLESANEKFAGFRDEGDFVGILVIIWDDFIYEPITSLVAEEAQGLLTPNSFNRTGEGEPIQYPNIDGVILIRHLTYFSNAAGDRPIEERKHAFDFGAENSLPNVFIPVPGGRDVADEIKTTFRALPLDHPMVANSADYRPQEMIMWLNV